MNTDTGEIRKLADLTEAERESGKWILIHRKWVKKYEQKVPVTSADFARILAAEERRKRRAAKRLTVTP